MRLIIDLLQMDEWLKVGENVDIAKGKYKLETTLKAKIKQDKRRKAWQ
jgi:hypothetical protein